MKAKRVAASAAASLILGEYRDARVVGVGTGSTVSLVLEEIARLEPSFYKGRLFLASSLDTLEKLRRFGAEALALGVSSATPELYFDGADEVIVARGCPAIKGRGAALYLEKILAAYSREAILVVDSSKVSNTLGEKGKPLPIDVDILALRGVERKLEELGLEYKLRKGGGKDGPVISDAGGVVLDISIGGRSVEEIAGFLESLPGVRATGYFQGLFSRLIVGYDDNRVLHYSCKKGEVIPWQRGPG